MADEQQTTTEETTTTEQPQTAEAEVTQKEVAAATSAEVTHSLCMLLAGGDISTVPKTIQLVDVSADYTINFTDEQGDKTVSGIIIVINTSYKALEEWLGADYVIWTTDYPTPGSWDKCTVKDLEQFIALV